MNSSNRWVVLATCIALTANAAHAAQANAATPLRFDPLKEGLQTVPGVENLRIRAWDAAGSDSPRLSIVP